MQVNKMHKQSSELVKAGTQAELIKAIEDMLTQEEHAVFKRGRNAKSATSAKNASVIDYRMATGMEALVGWLFLRQEYNRLVYLISQGLEKDVYKRQYLHSPLYSCWQPLLYIPWPMAFISASSILTW